MIVDKFEIEKREAKEFKPFLEDMYEVELTDVNAEMRPTYDTRLKPEAEQELERILSFEFTLLDGTEEDESLRGRKVWANFIPATLWIGSKGKNKLYDVVEGVLGHELTPEEEAKLDSDFVNGLVGKVCRGVTENTTKGDKTFTNIVKYLATKGTAKALTTEEKAKKEDKEPKESTVDENLDKINMDVEVDDVVEAFGKD